MSGSAVCPTCGAPVTTGARFCASCGTALVASAPEERKLATILFADVIGSTDLGEQLDPERLRALLRDYFGAMAAVVDTWGGTIEKYVGDAILAVWGVPSAREDDPVRALHAAHDMLTELERLNPSLEQRHGVALQVRIGVNTGEVLAPVGAQPAGQFLVSGDAVNVAARLEQSAEPGSVYVGERTHAAARAAFEFSEPVSLEVKGKRAALSAWRLGNPIRSDPGSEPARPLQSRMLGRDRELHTLLGLLDEVVEDGAPRLVLVSGPAGIGKSRMLREFIAAAGERQRNLVVLRGRCLATGHGITFWALGEVLRSIAGISLDEPAESAADKLQRRAVGPLAALGLAPDEIARSVAALALSANLPLTSDPLRDLGPEDMADEMAGAWPRLLTGIARTKAVALVIEDIHWADERMLRLIEAIATRSRGPLLVVATARPEFLEANAGFGSGADISVVALRALSEAQSGQLIDELLGSVDLPSTLVEDIQRKADGNPFFLEEIIQRLIDEGALRTEDGLWRATERAASVQLPDTIYALLAARIDALPADEKLLLQEAAVVGRIFWPGALGAAGAATEEVLRRAERRGLITLRPISTLENEHEYMFRHVLIRDVAYSSVPRRRRALAHAETGRWIEGLARDRADEFAELIAFHYAAAVSGEDADLGWADDAVGREEVRRRAFDMLVRAGASARRRFAVDKALELHGQALELAPTDEERATAHEELGDDHEALFHGDEAVREYLAADELLSQTASDHRIGEAVDSAGRSDISSRARLAAKAGRMVMRWGTFQERPQIERVQGLIDKALSAQVDDRLRATLLIVHGGLMPGFTGVPIAAGRTTVTADQQAQMQARIDAINEGLELARQLDDIDLIFLATDVLTVAYHGAQDYEHQSELAEQHGMLFDRLVSVRQQVDALVSLASSRTDRGDFASALEAAEEGYARSVGLSGHERMHIGYELIAAAEPLGRWDRIEEVLPWFVAAAAAEGDITCASVRGGPPFGATVVARRGDIRRALEMVPPTPVRPEEGTFVTAAHFANLASLTKPPDEARIVAREALEHTSSGFLELGISPMLEALSRLEMYDELASFLPIAESRLNAVATVEPGAERARGELAMRRGDLEEAQRRLRSALHRFLELNAPYQIARSEELLAAIVNGSEREQLLTSALGRYKELRAVPDAERVLGALGSEVGASG